MNKKELLRRIPKIHLVEYFLSTEIKDNKLYSCEHIANRLNINFHTVKKYVYLIFKKLNIEKIIIDNKTYFGKESTIKKIKKIILNE